MNKAKKVWLIAAACLVTAGLLAFGGAMVALGMEFAGLSTVDYVTNTYKLQGDFENINITAAEADVVLVWANDGVCRVVSKEWEKVTYSASMNNRTLNVEVHDSRAWYDYIGIFLEEPTVTVYLPRNSYDTCRITASTGDVSVPRNLSFRDLEIVASTGEVDCLGGADNLNVQSRTGDIFVKECESKELRVTAGTGDVEICETKLGTAWVETTTGDIDLTQITASNCDTKSSTGEVCLENVTALGDLHVETGTGDIELKQCDAGDLELRTSTGDVTASLLSPKLFTAKSSTGRIRVPASAPGEECRITTETGDISVTITAQ